MSSSIPIVILSFFKSFRTTIVSHISLKIYDNIDIFGNLTQVRVLLLYIIDKISSAVVSTELLSFFGGLNKLFSGRLRLN